MESEDKSNNNQETGPGNIDEILKQRDRIDQVIREKFKKRVTILFTDICGYTQYTDTRGDISSRSMLHRHNSIVMPAVEKNNGTVIKTIGDAVMATFPDSLSAVKSAVDIQTGLSEYNTIAEAGNQIHVKIGINTGDALIDNQDLFGDAVNVASRIQSQAGKDEILISKSVYEEVCGSVDILCRYHTDVHVKGKTRSLELYRVVWQNEDVIMPGEQDVPGQGIIRSTRSSTNMTIFQLELTREGDRLKISAYEQKPGESSTVRHYDEQPVPIDHIEERCHEIIETLNTANRKGRLSRDVLMKLREIGQIFRDELLSLDVKEKIQATKADYLILHLDDQLVHIPWELLHDGQQFLCQRFNMGRLVKTRQAVSSGKSRRLARPLKMLILADPKGDLKGAYKEGTEIRDYIDQEKEFINVSLQAGNISADFIKGKLRNFDLVHYAGHADYDPDNPANSGWRLTNGLISAQEIMKMSRTAVMPALIFSNACQSARTEEWRINEAFQDEIFGLANAFILSGVKHYVGTFWEILDEPSRLFAIEFYKRLLAGSTLGEAMRLSRSMLIKKYGEETIVWASYLLYGDPTSNYMDQLQDSIPVEEAMSPGPETGEGEVRAEGKEDVIDFTRKSSKGKTFKWLGAAALFIAILAFVLWGYPGFLGTGTLDIENQALAYYQQGNYEEALKTCRIIMDKDSHVRSAYLLQGNILFRQGGLEEAQQAYSQALEANKGTDSQKAQAFIGLGRIASLQKQTDQALSFYEKASQAAPRSQDGYISQAVLLETKGDYETALSLMSRAQVLAPEDHTVRSMMDDIRKKAEMVNDREKQGRIDQLVQDLIKQMDSPEQKAPSVDGWTSTPLTMWLMDFGIQGYSLREGEDRLLANGLTGHLLEHSRCQVVERALLDKLLEELKLGTSKMIDRNTALSLGRIMAAKLILSGQIIHSGPQTQVSMRLIETETGRIGIAISESFGSDVPAYILSEKIGRALIEKISLSYPLRGKITKAVPPEVKLNIGMIQGVQVGQHFKISGQDARIEILSTEADTSTGRVMEEADDLSEGMRVEIIL